MGGNLAFAAECARALETAVLFMTAEARLGPHDIARVNTLSRYRFNVALQRTFLYSVTPFRNHSH